nr:unnamed protein product [Callosobruchus analis]
MDAGGDRLLHSSNIAVIREVYDSEYSPQCFSMELEKALESRCSIIVIEPSQLGDETARWITFGNYLHKTAVISGITSIVLGFAWPDSFTPQAPLSIFSLLCTGLYTASWQFDHCVKYQVSTTVTSSILYLKITITSLLFILFLDSLQNKVCN